MKHIVIAGTARAGKTSLCYNLYKNGYVHLKLDSIKRAICDIYNDGNNWKDFSPKTAKMINRIIDEMETDTISGKEKYVIDTCHLLPQDALKISSDKAIIVFIGYADITPEEVVSNIRKYDQPNYWTTKLSNEELMKMSEENIEFSKKIKNECKELNILYYDTSYDREDVLMNIEEYIYSHNKTIN